MEGLWAVALLCVGSNPPLIEPTLEVDCVELNQVWDVCYDDGKAPGERWSIKKRLSQTIGWRWDPDQIYHVDWWTWDLHEPIDYRDGWWIFRFKPRNTDPVRVKARRVIRTDTFYDPEVEDRAVYPEAERAGLYPWKYFSLPRQDNFYDFKE